MIILITGGTHTGKTVLAQKLLEQYQYPYLSMDHLKMGLIRSGFCLLTPESDAAEITRVLWPIVREMIKTAVENRQHLIVEGCYIPFSYQADFSPAYLREIRYVCLILSESYIQTHFADIQKYACAIERRPDDTALSAAWLLRENQENLQQCKAHGLRYVLDEDRFNLSGWIPPAR